MMHRKAQVGVAGNVGCGLVKPGHHLAVQAAEKDVVHVCAVRDEVRMKDRRFLELCARPKRGRMAYMSEGAYVHAWRTYGTGADGVEAFGRGYCHFLALRQGFENRVARVFGPNMYVSDYLKVLCVAGMCGMRPLVVSEVAPGFLHVSYALDSRVYAGAGKSFYKKMVMAVQMDPQVRIGSSLEIKAPMLLSGAVRSLQFGSMEVEWTTELQERVLGVVANIEGEAVARLLETKLNRDVVSAEEKNKIGRNYERNRRNRENKRMARFERAGLVHGDVFRPGVVEKVFEEALVNVSDKYGEGEISKSWADEMMELMV